MFVSVMTMITLFCVVYKEWEWRSPALVQLPSPLTSGWDVSALTAIKAHCH